jgi:hypothetical protein
MALTSELSPGRSHLAGKRRTDPVVRFSFIVNAQFFKFIVSAFELYADRKSKGSGDNRRKRFKETFSRPDVKVHFLGAWCV